MKFNLKNRPIASVEKQEDGRLVVELMKPSLYIKKSEEWFEGFEKQLRDILTTEVIVLPDGSKRCMKVVSIFDILGGSS